MKTTAFHYTSMDTAIKILESRRFHFTNIRCCNDGNEYLYGVEQFRKVFRSISDGAVFPEIELQLAPFWVACFSEEPDSVSQWQQYADKATGLCLEFDLEKLVSSIEPVFQIDSRSICYDTEKQIETLEAHATKISGGDMSEVFSDICAMKQKGFWSEKETRLCIFHMPGSRIVTYPEHDIQYRISNGLVVPFLKSPEFPRDCLCGVRLGPKSKSIANKLHLEMLLNDLGFKPNVSESEISIR